MLPFIRMFKGLGRLEDPLDLSNVSRMIGIFRMQSCLQKELPFTGSIASSFTQGQFACIKGRSVRIDVCICVSHALEAVGAWHIPCVARFMISLVDDIISDREFWIVAIKS